MSLKKAEVFKEMMEEFLFNFQLETGLILNLKNIGYAQNGMINIYNGFQFEVLSSGGKILASYKAVPERLSIEMLVNFNLEPEDELQVQKAFNSFYKTFKIKSMFSVK